MFHIRLLACHPIITFLLVELHYIKGKHDWVQGCAQLWGVELEFPRSGAKLWSAAPPHNYLALGGMPCEIKLLVICQYLRANGGQVHSLFLFLLFASLPPCYSLRGRSSRVVWHSQSAFQQRSSPASDSSSLQPQTSGSLAESEVWLEPQTGRVHPWWGETKQRATEEWGHVNSCYIPHWLEVEDAWNYSCPLHPGAARNGCTGCWAWHQQQGESYLHQGLTKVPNGCYYTTICLLGVAVTTSVMAVTIPTPLFLKS